MGSAGRRNTRQTLLEGLRLSSFTAPQARLPETQELSSPAVDHFLAHFPAGYLEEIPEPFWTLSPEGVLENQEQLLVDWPELSSMGGATETQCPPQAHPTNQGQKVPRGQSLADGLTVRK